MKRGFTLVELLVVVVVIVTLMGVTFRLMGVGTDSTARNKTVNRLQRLENCLSGYYAAYGSYPPVKLHGSRNYRLETDEHGLQTGNEWGGNIRDADSGYDMRATPVGRSIDAACRAQPIGMSFPFTEEGMGEAASSLSAVMMLESPGSRIANFQALYRPNLIGNECREKVEWKDTQVFKFGVLSYFLPRYLLVMGGDSNQNKEFFTKFEQWKANNQLPPRFQDGVPFNSWEEVNSALGNSPSGDTAPWMIAALPSQVTCARWLPNLEKQLVTTSKTAEKTYGIELQDPDTTGFTPLNVYPADGRADSYSQQFVPDQITVLDGWGYEYYYFSSPPHQSYRLWSSGKNRKTFPPWLTDEEMAQLDNGDRLVVQKWVADDIVHMSN